MSSAQLIPIHQLAGAKHALNHRQFDSSKPILRWSTKSTAIRCCARRKTERRGRSQNYYELLGVSVDSTSQQIKEAYRKLQKKHHPDIAGQEGHYRTLMLNEAYRILMREDLRAEYDISIGHMRLGFHGDESGTEYSTWRGPLRPQALFVDENACIGCGECMYHASNTFTMDKTFGCARVKVQYGDNDDKIQVSFDSCPVNCIHWVDTEDLQVLEHLMRPQPKQGHGIYGQGWERPKNVFTAAQSFKKQLKQQADKIQRNVRQSDERETPAQAGARATASIKLKMENFSRIWSWVKEIASY